MYTIATKEWNGLPLQHSLFIGFYNAVQCRDWSNRDDVKPKNISVHRNSVRCRGDNIGHYNRKRNHVRAAKVALVETLPKANSYIYLPCASW